MSYIIKSDVNKTQSITGQIKNAAARVSFEGDISEATVNLSVDNTMNSLQNEGQNYVTENTAKNYVSLAEFMNHIADALNRKDISLSKTGKR